MPVATAFENLEVGSDKIIEQFHVTREQVQAVLEFAARSLDARPVPTREPLRPRRILFGHGTPSGIVRSLGGVAVFLLTT